MARYLHGINGPFQGKVGTVVGATWKGIPYMRSRPRKRTGPISNAERSSRNKFAMAHAWLQPTLGFVRQGFKGYTPTVEGFLAAKSYLLKNAFEVDGLNHVINPAKVKVSAGNLPLANDLSVELKRGEENQLLFTWDVTSLPGSSRYDQVMILAYDVEHGVALHKITGQFRCDGVDKLALHGRKGTFHIYAAFVADDRKSQSDSVYLGSVTV